MIQLPSLRMAAALGGLRKSASDHGKSPPVVAGAPVEIQPASLPEAFEQRRQVAFDAAPLDPQLSSSSGVKLCTYHDQRWFAR